MWSLSSVLLVTSTGLCLSASIRGLHPLTKLMLVTAVVQSLRLDRQNAQMKDEG